MANFKTDGGNLLVGFTLFCLLLQPSAGCKKFLDTRPSSTTVNPTTITDFEEMLNNDSLALCNFILADVMSDDIRMNDAMLQSDTSAYYAHSYGWSKNIWNPGDQDFMYNSAYARILQMNIILGKIDGADGTTQQKNIVRAQAQIDRAWYYLQLANLYGQGYQAATAATDLAVPLILTPNANALPSRATVQEVYNQILQDLNAATAAAELPAMGQTIVHPGKASGYALLAKAYLYMGNYQQAENAADAALAIRNTLSNYNTGYTMPGTLLNLSANPETLLARLCNDYNFISKYSNISFSMDATLKSLLDSNDTRLLKKFNNGDSYNIFNNNYQAFNYSVNVPEVLLIKAECLARKGDAAGSIALLNQLRQNRLVSFVPLDPSVDALTAVLQERRRELFYHGGSRLFDLKRLNRESRFAQTLQRVADDGATVSATLSPNSPGYLMQFSPVIVANNPNMVQNPR